MLGVATLRAILNALTAQALEGLRILDSSHSKQRKK